jgi:hypothetical protein
VDNPLEDTPTNVMKLQPTLEKLNKIHVGSGNISGFLIPFSNPNRIHERNLHICKDI